METETDFLRLLQAHQTDLWRFIRSGVRTQSEAEDILAETVACAYEGFTKLRDKQAFLSYVFTIASRTIKKRAWKRRLFIEVSADFNCDEYCNDGVPPDIQADIQFLREALSRLPDKTREAVILFEIVGLSLNEIQTIQGGSLSGVKSRLVRGRKHLARIMGVENPTHAEERLDGNRYEFTADVLPTIAEAGL
ncbi:MAG: RNA polymerase sigma factor [Chlorobi bacterium]|nr:MAG: RNA polymerase sigma factor [Bacteroidota bacterium]KXK35273.1 MAG: ECF subfamily RNA polymerase sigma-70 factor [Chlorobi bacterium OLB6]MBE2264920.1 RNA polymerase sigma factor [Flavobacteriales bacterium]MBL1160583.1 RNA polymerase sigma factor [Chlorobiota bacterium]MBW7853169.1 RNA polymerase sigma factor [Candidatus Kapabacteria bacterium]MCC6331342.1 RNA polymerase sigma factor [Ignavibacteria bacterium]